MTELIINDIDNEIIMKGIEALKKLEVIKLNTRKAANKYYEVHKIKVQEAKMKKYQEIKATRQTDQELDQKIKDKRNKYRANNKELISNIAKTFYERHKDEIKLKNKENYTSKRKSNKISLESVSTQT